MKSPIKKLNLCFSLVAQLLVTSYIVNNILSIEKTKSNHRKVFLITIL